MPKMYCGIDIFLELSKVLRAMDLQSLMKAHYDAWGDIMRSNYQLWNPGNPANPLDRDDWRVPDRLHVYMDEAQVMDRKLVGCFRSVQDRTQLRPMLSGVDHFFSEWLGTGAVLV